MNNKHIKAFFVLLIVAMNTLAYSADYRFVGVIKDFKQNNASEGVAQVKDNAGGTIHQIFITDSLTLGRFKDKVFIVGDEVRIKYDDSSGRKISMLFRKTSGDNDSPALKATSPQSTGGQTTVKTTVASSSRDHTNTHAGPCSPGPAKGRPVLYNFDNLLLSMPTTPKSFHENGSIADARRQLERMEQTDQSRRRAATASSSGSGKGNKSTCFSIKNDNMRYACLAQFDGKSTCFSIKNDNMRYACLAQFDGKSTCFSVKNDDMRYACLAQFDGKSTCFSIKDDDERYGCLAQFDGKSTCFSIKSNDERYACLAQFQ